jgi:membrane peptidoglycan carboxypeptidase
MSDRPENTKPGWRSPADPNAWRSMVSHASKRIAVKRTPSLLASVPAQPQVVGGWHQPAASDTSALPLPRAPRPEDALPAAVVAAPAPAPTLGARPEDAVALPRSVAAPRPEDSIPQPAAKAPVIEIAPLADDEVDLLEELDIEEVDLLAEAVADDLADPFGFDEETALMALIDEEEGVSDLEDEQPTKLAPAAQAATPMAADDYMRQQLAALQAEQAGDTEQLTSTAPVSPTASTGGFDYAAQIDALQGGTAPVGTSSAEVAAAATTSPIQAADGSDFSYTSVLSQLQQGQTPVTAPTNIDPATQALAQTFIQRETEIRTLRQQRQLGQISEDQYQQLLRELMVLDERAGVWWMMGPDTEIWYRWNNQMNNWEVAEPPRPSTYGTPSIQAIRTDTGNIDPRQVIAGAALPNVGFGDGGYTAPSTFGSTAGFTPETGGYQAPASARQDLGATVVGSAAYVDILPSSQQTVPSMGAVAASADVTQRARPISEDDDYDGYEEAGIDSPIAEVAPAYGETELEEVGDRVARARRNRERSQYQTLITVLVVLFGLALIATAVPVAVGTLWYRSISERWQDGIANFGAFEFDFQTVRILDVTGAEIAEIRSEQGGNRTQVTLQQVAPAMMHAVISVEDERFFTNPGFDVISISRAFLQNLSGGEVVSGGSTITQQLARNIVFTADSQFANEADRKLNEIIVAAEISRVYSKEQILETYLNQVYFGNQAYGVEAAAQFYFDKRALELNTGEAMMLAGLIQAPSAYDPVTNPQAAFDRIDVVERQMIDAGCLPIPYQAQPVCYDTEFFRGTVREEIADVELTRYTPANVERDHPHFVDYVFQRLQLDYTQEQIFRRGFVVTTTLDPSLQTFAEEQLRSTVESRSTTGMNTGGIIVTDPRTGAIRAMVGSPDYNNEEIDGQFNTTLSYQQPGSSIKPIVYTGALNGSPRGYLTASSILWDVPTSYPDGTAIRNFDNEFHGPVSLRTALQNSYNIPAVKAYDFVGNETFQQIATAMGLRFLDDATFGLPTGIGATEVRPIDMAQAYGTLANDGRRVPLYVIETITDSLGNPIVLPNQPEPTQAITQQVAFLMQNILIDDASRQPEFGVNTQLAFREFPNQIAAKTGTSNENRDLWTVGFSNNVVAVVWLGRHDNNPIFNTGSYESAAPLWNQVIRQALRNQAPGEFNVPGGVVIRPVCAATGELVDTQAGTLCPSATRNEYFIDNQLPNSPALTTIEVDTWTGLLADPNFCPDNIAVVTVSNITDNTAINWLNTTAQGRTVAQQLGLSVPVPQRPSASCDINTARLSAGITSPQYGATVQQVQVSIQGSIGGVTNVASYDIQVAPAGTGNYQIVAGPFTTLPVGGAPLGVWDASSFPNGTYDLRLAMNSTSGGYAFRSVQINLAKPLPTATPTMPAIPTSPPIIGSTAIPFEQATLLPFDNGTTTSNSQAVPLPSVTPDFRP